jgi:rhomboid protease GluP
MAYDANLEYKEKYEFNNFDPLVFKAWAVMAISRLEWDINFINSSKIVAHTTPKVNSFSKKISILINERSALLICKSSPDEIIDRGSNRQHIETLISEIDKLRESLTDKDIKQILENIDLYAPKEQLEEIKNVQENNTNSSSDFINIFKTTSGYLVSPILIYINVVIFIIMVMTGVHFLTPEGIEFIKWGANFRPLTLDGQLWRLFTACFLHVGIDHLLFNIFALYFIGWQLEPYLGKIRFLSAYFISGIAGSLCSLWWHEFSICVGASGAIFGMYGVFIVLLTSNILEKSIKSKMLGSIVIFVLYSLFNGLMVESGIDNAAHIGGLISGLVIGYAFIPSLRITQNVILKFGTIFMLLFFLSLSTWAVYLEFTRYQPTTTSFSKIEGFEEVVDGFQEKMDNFIAMESMAVEFYNMPENTPKHKIMREIETRSLYYWDENMVLLDSFDESEMPENLVIFISKLREYCNLRIKSLNLIYKGLDENTNRYKKQLDQIYIKIDSLVKEIRSEMYN